MKASQPAVEGLKREWAEKGLHTFQYMVENSIDAILMTDRDLLIVYANRACSQLMAIMRQDAL